MAGRGPRRERRRGTGRSAPLLDQFDRARELAQVRLTGPGDDEYRWEPVPGCRSVRRREEATAPGAYGPGDRVPDEGAPDAGEAVRPARSPGPGRDRLRRST
ncbi:hypothetical protein [Streptomyces sp. NPDC101237]|uniref:hypothetical protein n=1 Tax=Streptomyces sp. NPDC101237 TaxID=3366139 RepID=UPI0037FF30FD